MFFFAVNSLIITASNTQGNTKKKIDHFLNKVSLFHRYTKRKKISCAYQENIDFIILFSYDVSDKMILLLNLKTIMADDKQVLLSCNKFLDTENIKLNSKITSEIDLMISWEGNIWCFSRINL